MEDLTEIDLARRAHPKRDIFGRIRARSTLNAHFPQRRTLDCDSVQRIGPHLRARRRPCGRISARQPCRVRNNFGEPRLISSYLALSRRFAGASSLYLRPTRPRRDDLNPPCAQRCGCVAHETKRKPRERVPWALAHAAWRMTRDFLFAYGCASRSTWSTQAHTKASPSLVAEICPW